MFIWDTVKAVLPKPLPQRPLTLPELKDHWSTLSDPEPTRAYVALETLSAIPKQSVPFLKDEFRRLPRVEPKQIAQWILDLNAKSFRARDKATRELRMVGEVAKPALENALANHPSLEMKQRIDQLLAFFQPGNMAPERLRLLRTIQILEKISTPEARELLVPRPD